MSQNLPVIRVLDEQAKRAIYSYLGLNKIYHLTVVATTCLNRIYQNFTHRFMATKSQLSLLMGEIALIVSK